MLDPKCIYRKSIFAKCTRLACLLSFASLFYIDLINSYYGTKISRWNSVYGKSFVHTCMGHNQNFKSTGNNDMHIFILKPIWQVSLDHRILVSQTGYNILPKVGRGNTSPNCSTGKSRYLVLN